MNEPAAEEPRVVCSERLEAGPAEALAGALALDAAPVTDDGVLPPLWHWVYLLDRPPLAALGPDGHRRTGGVPRPPGPGMRRMIAGGRVQSLAPLRLGESATRTTRVLRQAEKEGRSGRLIFVTVETEIVSGGELAVREELDVVYRPAGSVLPRAEEPGPPRPVGADERQERVDPVLLFRFSALTYNSHRIHYDRTYAAEVEGYRGLVVHGPMQALLMAEHARRAQGAALPCAFGYRLIAPLHDDEGLVIGGHPSGRGYETYARDSRGRVTATGELRGGTPAGSAPEGSPRGE